MAADSTMPEAEVHQEIGRRTIQISDLKEELWDLRDRIEDVEHRSDSLVQGLTGKAHEISVRKSKCNGLEDKVALLEGRGEEHVRSLRRATADASAELQQLQEQQAKIDEASASALARAAADRHRIEVMSGEGSSMRAKIEAAKRLLAHDRDELAQDEAAHAARQLRAEKAFDHEEVERREYASIQLTTATDAAATARSQVLRLEKAVTMERDSATSLHKSLGQSQRRYELAQEECEAMEAKLEAMQMQGEFEAEERILEEEMSTSKRHVQRLQQQVANHRSETAFRRQSLQGALDETLRMLQDHTENIQAAPSNPGLEALAQALAEAKHQKSEQQSIVASLELECNSLQADLGRIETDAVDISRQSSTDQQRQHTDLTLELRAAEQSLRSASRRADDKAVEAVRAEAKIIEADKSAKQNEAFLRGKLVEIWSWLRHVS